MFSRTVLFLVLLGFAGYALADGINNPAINGNGIGLGEGINNLGVGGGSVTPSGCNGVLDFSTGCAQPLPGGI